MKPPVIDVFIGRDGEAWRLYFGPSSWKPGQFAKVPDLPSQVGRPNVAGLDRFTRKVGVRIERRPTVDGGVEIMARGKGCSGYCGVARAPRGPSMNRCTNRCGKMKDTPRRHPETDLTREECDACIARGV